MDKKMGKIFEFPKGKGRGGVEKLESSRLEQANLVIFFTDLMNDENYKPLLNIIGPVNIQSTAVYQENIKALSGDELIDKIKNSTPLDWDQKPAWYRAIMDEIARRVGKK